MKRLGRLFLSRICIFPATFTLLGVLPAAAQSQYQLHDLADFEEGKLPPDAVTIGPKPDQTIQVVELDKVQGMPPEFRSTQAARETGKYALKLRVTPDPEDFKTNSTGISIGKVLDRSQLGAKGRALYQADFYLPAGETIPNLAVLAMEPPDENEQTRTVETVRKPFYRFGITNNRRVYLSSYHPKEQKSNIFHYDEPLTKQLPRPGWHRFAIVMEGPQTIRCYVDGRETSFSPITDTKLKKLLVGVMLADNKLSYDAYADNLSIQVSEDAALMPESPYQQGWQIAAGNKQQRQSGTPRPATPTPAITSGINWLEPGEAWQRAQAERKPLLLYFYAPGISGTEKMEEFFATAPGAKDFLARHAAARIDVNQLQGGKIAKQYQVFKVPTFITLAPDRSTYKRSTPARDATWQEIQSELTLP